MNDLIIFLCKVVEKSQKSRMEALSKNDRQCKSHLSLYYPVVQGLESQMRIKKISELTYNKDKAGDQMSRFLKRMSNLYEKRMNRINKKRRTIKSKTLTEVSDDR